KHTHLDVWRFYLLRWGKAFDGVNLARNDGLQRGGSRLISKRTAETAETVSGDIVLAWVVLGFECSLLIGRPRLHPGVPHRVAVAIDGGHGHFDGVFTLGDDLWALADEAYVDIGADGLRWHDAAFGLILIANNWVTVTELTVRRFINTHFLLLFKSRPAYSNVVVFLPRRTMSNYYDNEEF